MTQPAVQSVSPKWKTLFFAIWGGQAISLLGSQLVQFALIWWLTKTTCSATVLAIASLFGLLPQVIIGPFIGALVDRWNRRLIMIVADSLIALATAGLALLFWLSDVQIWQIYLLMFIRATAGGFHWSAMQASTSLMVPKEHLARIQGLNQMLSGAMNIGSAPLAALLLNVLPMQTILAIDICTALVAVTPLLFIAVPQPPRTITAESSDGRSSVWQDLGAGFRYVWAWPGLVLIVLMATIINLLLTPTGSLQPILVTQHFGGGAMQLAWLETAWGLGVVAGGLTLSAWGGFRRQVFTSLTSLIVLGGGMIIIGLIPPAGMWLALVMFFVVGFTNPLINGPLFAILQSVVTPDMQGRVFTLILSFAAAMSPVGLLVAGPIADRFGVQSWFIAGGIVTALLGVGAFFVPAIINIEKDPNHKQSLDVDAPVSEHVGISAKVAGD